MPEDFIRLMHCLFLPAVERNLETPWQPAADVSRRHWGWLVKFELAGVRLEDIDLTARDQHLTVRGTRRDWCSQERATHYLMEIAYSHFERSIELPCNLELAEITSEYRDGMLVVRIQMEANP